jgi:hypothetical protein
LDPRVGIVIFINPPIALGIISSHQLHELLIMGDYNQLEVFLAFSALYDLNQGIS